MKISYRGEWNTTSRSFHSCTLPEECNNAGPLSSDLSGKCTFWACHSLFFSLLLNPTLSFLLYLYSPLFLALLLLICIYTFQISPSFFSLASWTILNYSSWSVLPDNFYDYLGFLSTPKLSGHRLAHSGLLVLFIPMLLCCLFRILQFICPNLNYFMWTASLISMLPDDN